MARRDTSMKGWTPVKDKKGNEVWKRNDSLRGSDGTYFYMGKWYYYDKILISSSIASNSNFSFKILNLDFLSKDGFPLRYDNSSECGYSDHFALRLDLK